MGDEKKVFSKIPKIKPEKKDKAAEAELKGKKVKLPNVSVIKDKVNLKDTKLLDKLGILQGMAIGSIRVKMLASYVLMIGFIVVVGLVSYYIGAKTIRESYNTSARQSVEMLGEYFSFGFNTVKSTAVEYMTSADLTNYLDKRLDNPTEVKFYQTTKDELTTKAAADTFIESMYFFSEGISSISTNKLSADNMYSQYTASEQGQYVKGDDQKYYWLGAASPVDEILNVVQDNYAVRLVKAFYRREAFLMIDIEKAAIVNGLNKIDFGEGSKVSFVTEDGVEIDDLGTKEEFFTELKCYDEALTSENESGVIENVRANGTKNLFVYKKLTDTNSMVCALIPNKIFMGQLSTIKYIVAVLIVLAVVFAGLIGGGISLSMNNSINYFIRKLASVAKGNIGTKFNVKTKDEFAQLALHMNEMLESVSGLLAEARDVSSKVSLSVQKVTDSSESISDSANTISKAMEEIEDGLSQQADDTVAGVNKMEILADQIEAVEQETREIKDIADSARVLSGTV